MNIDWQLTVVHVHVLVQRPYPKTFQASHILYLMLQNVEKVAITCFANQEYS